MDYHGQKLCEDVYVWILVIGCVIAFFAGWVNDDYTLMFRVWGGTSCVARESDSRGRGREGRHFGHHCNRLLLPGLEVIHCLRGKMLSRNGVAAPFPSPPPQPLNSTPQSPQCSLRSRTGLFTIETRSSGWTNFLPTKGVQTKTMQRLPMTKEKRTSEIAGRLEGEGYFVGGRGRGGVARIASTKTKAGRAGEGA